MNALILHPYLLEFFVLLDKVFCLNYYHAKEKKCAYMRTFNMLSNSRTKTLFIYTDST